MNPFAKLGPQLEALFKTEAQKDRELCAQIQQARDKMPVLCGAKHFSTFETRNTSSSISVSFFDEGQSNQTWKELEIKVNQIAYASGIPVLNSKQEIAGDMIQDACLITLGLPSSTNIEEAIRKLDIAISDAGRPVAQKQSVEATAHQLG